MPCPEWDSCPPGRSIRREKHDRYYGATGVGNVKPIRWAWVYGLWVARDLVLTNVSWNQLNQYGLTTGKDIEISGVKYQVRCPQLGTDYEQSNEWDAILKEAGERDRFNYMLDGWFWGLDTCPGGWHPIRNGGWVPREGSLDANFRPVMRPIIIEPDNSWTGATLQVLSKSGEAIVGVLDEVGDYDLLLSNVARAPPGQEEIRTIFLPQPWQETGCVGSESGAICSGIFLGLVQQQNCDSHIGIGFLSVPASEYTEKRRHEYVPG